MIPSPLDWIRLRAEMQQTSERLSNLASPDAVAVGLLAEADATLGFIEAKIAGDEKAELEALQTMQSAMQWRRDNPVRPPTTSQAIRFHYRNWQGKVALRHATPISLRFGTSEWHREEQWLMRAYDHDHQAECEFALTDCSFD